MDASRILRRIYDNLYWPGAAEPLTSDGAEDFWGRVAAVWHEPDRRFLAILYALLLGRQSDADGVAALCADLAAGAPRSVLVRRLALSDEARTSGLDLSWLPRLTAQEGHVFLPRLRALWRVPNSNFVERLYPLLLGRLADAPGAAGFVAALAAGATRSDVVRAVALSDEARRFGLDGSWLPRLTELERGRRRLFFRALAALRRRLAGWARACLRSGRPMPSASPPSGRTETRPPPPESERLRPAA